MSRIYLLITYMYIQAKGKNPKQGLWFSSKIVEASLHSHGSLYTVGSHSNQIPVTIP